MDSLEVASKILFKAKVLSILWKAEKEGTRHSSTGSPFWRAGANIDKAQFLVDKNIT